MIVTVSELSEELPLVLSARKVPIVISSPGMGKSSLARQIAKQFNLKLIDIRLSYCDPTDLNGLPFPNKQGTRASYLPVDIFPLEGDSLPLDENGEKMEGWLINFDELPSAVPAVQVAAYKVLLDREIGNNKLHENVLMMAAGNKESDNAVVHKLGTAMQSRLIHYELEVDKDAWLDWAYKAGIDYRVTSYIEYMPNRLMMFDPDHNDKTFPCPRTWEFLSDILKAQKKMANAPKDISATIAGTIGENVGYEFRAFLDIFKDLVTVDQIIKDPTGTPVPDSPNKLFALSGSIIDNFDPKHTIDIVEYLSRLPIEFQIITMKAVVKKDTSFLGNPRVKQWFAQNAKALTG